MVDILHSKKFKEHMNKIFVQRVKRGNYSEGFKHKLIRALNRSIDVCPNDINIELLRDELKRNGVKFEPYTDVYSANLSSLWDFFCGRIFVIQYDDIVNYENPILIESLENPQATAIEVFIMNDLCSKNLLLRRLNRIILTTILSQNNYKLNLPSIYLILLKIWISHKG